MVKKTEQIVEPVLNRCICGKAPAFGDGPDGIEIRCEGCGRVVSLNQKYGVPDDAYKRNLAMVWNNNVGSNTAVADTDIEALRKSTMPAAVNRLASILEDVGGLPPYLKPDTAGAFQQGFTNGFCEAVICIMEGSLKIKTVQVGGK